MTRANDRLSRLEGKWRAKPLLGVNWGDPLPPNHEDYEILVIKRVIVDADGTVLGPWKSPNFDPINGAGVGEADV